MKAIRFNRPFEAEVIEIPSPPLKPGEVRVKVGSSGICGSDVHRFQDLVSPGVWPMIPGHECGGTVIEVTPGTNARVGQRVAIMPMTTCGECPACRSGRINHCPDRQIMGPGRPGSYAEEIVVLPSMLRPIPDNVSFDEAALVEPIAVAVHAANRGPIKSGDRVAILGAGAIGLLLEQVVKAKGATYVLATGRGDEKLALARQLGADETVNVIREAVVTAQRTDAFDVVFDLVCDETTVDQALALASRGGSIVFIASPDKDRRVQVSLGDPNWLRKELRVARSIVYDADFDEAIPLIASGKVLALPVISHRYPLTEAPKALKTVIENRREVVKAILEP